MPAVSEECFWKGNRPQKEKRGSGGSTKSKGECLRWLQRGPCGCPPGGIEIVSKGAWVASPASGMEGSRERV